MLTLINTNRMAPPIGPVGLDYVAGAARAAGIETELLDLCLVADPAAAMREHFAARAPRLVGITFRNVDDCFWPSGESFVPPLAETVASLRALTDAPVVLGGVGYSILPERILSAAGADFGIHGDGEQAVVALYRQLQGRRRFEEVPGLFWWKPGKPPRAAGSGADPAEGLLRNAPAWPAELSVPTARDAIDNPAYFRAGGQGGVETKRGCPRACIYCADPLAKGRIVRARPPVEVADEVEALLARGVDVLHLCDGEFNIPGEHAAAVCDELIRRRLGERVRWYAYLAVVPFDAALASAMRTAGCAGINFTADSACPAMLASYRHAHGREDLALAGRLCRENGMAVMFDLLLGGPSETAETLAETIDFFKGLDATAVGAQLGLRICPGTAAEAIIAAEGPMEANPAIRRKYAGPVDLLRPTFYISTALGEAPARLVRDLIGPDERFFPPAEAGDDPARVGADYNYNDNAPLVDAIANGARGAYWHILRQRGGA